MNPGKEWVLSIPYNWIKSNNYLNIVHFVRKDCRPYCDTIKNCGPGFKGSQFFLYPLKNYHCGYLVYTFSPVKATFHPGKVSFPPGKLT